MTPDPLVIALLAARDSLRRQRQQHEARIATLQGEIQQLARLHAALQSQEDAISSDLQSRGADQ